MTGKWQVLGITRKNLHVQAWVFDALLVSNSTMETASPRIVPLNAVATLQRQVMHIGQYQNASENTS